MCGILYPYQNSVARESLDRGNAAKFGEDFCHHLESFSYTLRVQAGMDAFNPQKDASSRQSAAAKKDGAGVDASLNGDRHFDFLSLQEMRNVFDLLDLYL